jgi:phosphoserine phosphatase
MKIQQKMISVSAIGLDEPGLIAKITNKIFEMNGNIVDVEENCRRGLFTIFLVVDFSASTLTFEEITAALSVIQDETGLKVIVDQYEPENITRPTTQDNHLVTIIGVDQPGIIAKISSLFYSYNINIEKCRMIARGKLFSMEMLINTTTMNDDPVLSREARINKMKKDLKALCSSIDQSVVIQSDNIFKRNKKLVVFDVESSLVQHTSLKSFLNIIKDKVSTNGKLPVLEESGDQMQVLIDNAKYLKGLSVDDLERFNETLQLNPGTFELIKILKSMGFKIALLSSGFNFFIKKIFETAGVDYAFSNTLEIDEAGVATGKLEEPIITSDTKEELLEFIMQKENIDRDQVIAVGDGSKSSHFIENVGLSIALKPEDLSIETEGVPSNDKVLSVLYCLGVSKTELSKYLDDKEK